MEVLLGPIDAIPVGEGRAFSAGGAELAVFRSRDGRVFATQAACPHRGGPLADGLIGGGTLICPLHSLSFDLATGESANAECKLRTYPARVASGGVLVVEIEA